MKKIKNICYLFLFIALVFTGCEKEEAPDAIYVYFPKESVSLVENSGDAVDIPVKVFALSEMTDDVVINYSIEGEGADRINDITGGLLTIQKGEKACVDYITIEPVDNTESDGDANLSVVISNPEGNVVVGLGSDNQNATAQVAVLDNEISCLAELWNGSLSCTDGVWPSWSPTYCTGEKIDDSCEKIKVTFDFWQMGSLETVLELELGELDPVTNQGPVTLIKDYNAVGGGYDLTFHQGAAGIYDANTFELKLVLEFSGYDIGGDGKYRFTIKK